MYKNNLYKRNKKNKVARIMSAINASTSMSTDMPHMEYDQYLIDKFYGEEYSTSDEISEEIDEEIEKKK